MYFSISLSCENKCFCPCKRGYTSRKCLNVMLLDVFPRAGRWSIFMKQWLLPLPWQKTTRNSRPTDSHGTSAWPLENFLPFVRDSSAQLWYCLLVHLVSNLGKESYKHLVSFKDSQALIHSLFDRKPDSAETAPKTTLCQPWTCWCWLGAGNRLHGLLRTLLALFLHLYKRSGRRWIYSV